MLYRQFGHCFPSPWAGPGRVRSRNLEAQGWKLLPGSKVTVNSVLQESFQQGHLWGVSIILAFLNGKCWGCTVAMVTEKPVSH